MNRIVLSVISAVSLLAASSAFAAYNDPPDGDAQFAQCKSYSLARWTGGSAASPIAGQSKVEAFCTCMWNETPEDFKGNLAKFSETAKGAEANAMCEKYSNWGG